MMIIQRLELWFGLLKLAVEFVMVLFEAVGCAIDHSNSALATNPNYVVPYIGLLP